MSTVTYQFIWLLTGNIDIIFLFLDDSSVLILAVIVPVFHPIGELVTPIETSATEGNTEVEAQLLTEETKTRKCSK